MDKTEKAAEDFVKSFKDTTLNVFGLSGDLGAGKTTFVQMVGNILKVEEQITSPTFVIMKKYKINLGQFPFQNLIHVDAYRLESFKELITLGFQSVMDDRSNLILIEWPEKVIEILPSQTPIISFSHVSEDVRGIHFPDMMGI